MTAPIANNGSSTGRFQRLSWALMLVILCSVTRLAVAAELAAEQREFAVLVDDKPAGKYVMTITPTNDGVVTMAAKAEVKVTYFKVYTYSYSFEGTEVWNHERLQKLDSVSDDNGKKSRVKAEFAPDRSRITVNDKPRESSSVVCTTTYWHLPTSEIFHGGFQVIDADTGAALQAQAKQIAQQTVRVAGKVRPCTHVQIKQPALVELWFDESQRLVRQITVEDGHPTELRLQAVRRRGSDGQWVNEADAE